MIRNYKNANEAFQSIYRLISVYGLESANTKYIKNFGFYIDNPLTNRITNSLRNWKIDYAIKEWEWYVSGDNNAIEIAKHAKIWLNCMDENGNVNSNYGWHWNQNNQIKYIVDELTENKESRRASISIYNSKDRYNFKNDTPCTYAINFYIENETLCMSVLMRSNDLWYGFCNDQFCFSKLQKCIANELNLNVGSYYHFANDMHIYKNFLNKNI
tara:strand:- start:5378 stop:6019 length:642 start_codon:yes stop_codon:yes gene_type:complete